MPVMTANNRIVCRLLTRIYKYNLLEMSKFTELMRILMNNLRNYKKLCIYALKTIVIYITMYKVTGNVFLVNRGK